MATALRMRVRRSAIGSVMLIKLLASMKPVRPVRDGGREVPRRRSVGALPACFSHSGNLPLVRQVPETDSTDLELPVDRPGPTTQLTAVVPSGLELGLGVALVDQRLACHLGSSDKRFRRRPFLQRLK